MQILDSYPSMAPSFWFILSLIGIIGGICGVVVSMIDDKDVPAVICSIIVLISIVCAAILPKDVPNGKTTYVIQVDDTVNFNEFYKQYDILSKEPYVNIYRVEERENND